METLTLEYRGKIELTTGNAGHYWATWYSDDGWGYTTPPLSNAYNALREVMIYARAYEGKAETS